MINATNISALKNPSHSLILLALLFPSLFCSFASRSTFFLSLILSHTSFLIFQYTIMIHTTYEWQGSSFLLFELRVSCWDFAGRIDRIDAPVPTRHYTSHLFDAYVYRCSSQRGRVSFMTCSVNIAMSSCNNPSWLARSLKKIYVDRF